jgi:hypothetical protein
LDERSPLRTALSADDAAGGEQEDASGVVCASAAAFHGLLRIAGRAWMPCRTPRIVDVDHAVSLADVAALDR